MNNFPKKLFGGFVFFVFWDAHPLSLLICVCSSRSRTKPKGPPVDSSWYGRPQFGREGPRFSIHYSANHPPSSIIIPTQKLESRKNKEDYSFLFYFILRGSEISTRNDRHHRHFAFDLLCKIDRVCGGRCGLSICPCGWIDRVGWTGQHQQRCVLYDDLCGVRVGGSSFHLDGQTKKKKKKI
jgi:hypothetical protein